MTKLIDASKFSGPAELATAIRDEIGQLYIDDVLVKCGNAQHRVRPETVDHVCRGLLIASELAALCERKVRTP